MNEIDDRLRALRRELHELSWRRRRRVLDEARDHLLCAVDDGLTPAEAVAQLGDPAEAFRGFPKARRTHRAVTLAVPAMLLALAPSIGGPLARIGATVTPSRAASPTPGQVIARQNRAIRACATAWNAAPAADLRRAAVAADVRRAKVSIVYITKLGQPPTSGQMLCGVNLQPPPVASPYQPYLRVAGTPSGTTFTFGRLIHSRTRSEAPGANARVGASGRITLSGRPLQRDCPVGPIGTAVAAVDAGPHTPLRSTGSTRVSAAESRSFTVTIANAGRVAIHGAIISLAFTRPSHPDRLTWRSSPRTLAGLAAGSSTTVRFATPSSTPGAYLIRATTAGVACESRFADNSRVFQVTIR
jgi:hypothetical protein